MVKWILMLVIALSPMQVSLAQKAAPHDHPQNCQDMHVHGGIQLAMPDDHCENGHSDLCIDHPGCLAQMTFTSLQPIGEQLFAGLTSQTVRYARLRTDVLSRYLDSLTRPPNS